MNFDADIVIVGGGPVGACAGALLAKTAKVLLLEPGPKIAPVLPARVVALSHASERILTAAGAWHKIRAGANPYERMHVWHESTSPFGATKLSFDAAAAGESNLGWIVENSRVQSAVLEAFEAKGGTTERSSLEGAVFSADAVELRIAGRALRTRLLIGADGARSAVRDFAALPAAMSTYRQTAIVATVASELPHRATAWQRFMQSGTLALLPLADGTSSIVWSVDDEAAARLVGLEPSQFEQELTDASDAVLGALRLLTARAAFPLQRLVAKHYVAERCALIGDAAHVVHPLAGQGVNLGFLDAASLAQVLEDNPAREDPGALAGLRRYERWRLSENRLMDFAIDNFNRFLAHGTGPAAALAQRGLGWVDRSGTIKRLFVRHALGLSGEPPRAALVRT